MIAGVSDRWFENSTVLVVVVAVVNDEVGDWSAYQDASYFPTQGHTEPCQCRDVLVARASETGDKVSEAEAAALFPSLAARYRWRR